MPTEVSCNESLEGFAYNFSSYLCGTQMRNHSIIGPIVDLIDCAEHVVLGDGVEKGSALHKEEICS